MRVCLAQEVPAPELDGVHGQPLGELVELHLEGEAGLHGAVAALGPARRLVRVDAPRVEAVRRHAVGRREELSAVVGRHQPERRVGAAVEDDPGVDGRDLALRRRARPVPHLERVTPAVGVEDLLPGVEDLDRPPREHGQPGHRELEVEGLALAAERPADRRLDHPHHGGFQAQHPGDLPVQVVGHLRGRPHGEPAVPVEAPDGAVGLDGRVGRPLEEVVALDHHVGRLHAPVHVAEGELHELGHVPVPARLPGRVQVLAVLVAPLGRQRGLRIQPGRQLPVLDADPLQRLQRRVLVHGRHGGHRVPHVAHAVQGQGVLVGGPGDDPVAHGHVPARDHSVYARQRPGLRGVDGEDVGVGVGAPQDLAVEHAGEDDVVGEHGPARGLVQAVDLPQPGADQLEVGLGFTVARHGARPA